MSDNALEQMGDLLDEHFPEWRKDDELKRFLHDELYKQVVNTPGSKEYCDKLDEVLTNLRKTREGSRFLEDLLVVFKAKKWKKKKELTITA